MLGAPFPGGSGGTNTAALVADPTAGAGAEGPCAAADGLRLRAYRITPRSTLRAAAGGGAHVVTAVGAQAAGGAVAGATLAPADEAG